MQDGTSFHIDLQGDTEFAAQVDSDGLKTAVARTLHHHGAPVDTALALVIAGDDQMHTLNRQFRDVDAPTDVLAFPAASEAPFIEAPGEPPYLGDVVISFPRAAAQAAEADHAIEAELALLAVHGTLHLLGYDHATPQEKDIMWVAQRKILSELGFTLNLEERS